MCGHTTAAYLSHYARHDTASGRGDASHVARRLKRIACDIICEDRALSSSATSPKRGGITHKEVRFQLYDKESKSYALNIFFKASCNVIRVLFGCSRFTVLIDLPLSITHSNIFCI